MVGKGRHDIELSVTCCPSRQQVGQQTATHLTLVADDGVNELCVVLGRCGGSLIRDVYAHAAAF